MQRVSGDHSNSLANLLPVTEAENTANPPQTAQETNIVEPKKRTYRQLEQDENQNWPVSALLRGFNQLIQTLPFGANVLGPSPSPPTSDEIPANLLFTSKSMTEDSTEHLSSPPPSSTTSVQNKSTEPSISSSCFTGYREETYQNGGTYKGYFLNGRKHGKGHETFSNGEYYEGQFVNGQREGLGRYVFKDGTVYRGGWKNNLRDGDAIESYPNGDYYQGPFKNDYKHGKGTYVFNDNYVGKKPPFFF